MYLQSQQSISNRQATAGPNQSPQEMQRQQQSWPSQPPVMDRRTSDMDRQQATQPVRTGHEPMSPQSTSSIDHQVRPVPQQVVSDESQQGGKGRGNSSPSANIQPTSATRQKSPRTFSGENGSAKPQQTTRSIAPVAVGAGLGVAVGAGAGAAAVASAESGRSEDLNASEESSQNEVTRDATEATSATSQATGGNDGQQTDFHAELDDTEDARKRTMRLETQEGLIHYDPGADSDGEPAPQMSATSYPGQEWNPYGMPEYWNE